MTQTTRPLTDLEIARSIHLQPIQAVAERLGVLDDELDPYGKYIAKIDAPGILKRLKDRPNGRYVDVTGITPTPLGEGKSLTTVGLSLALNHIGKSTIGTIRQPSLGPMFGIKGGAAGGGYSQVLPMENFNLHLTGDTHAVSLAHNLCSAVIDAHIAQGNKLDIDTVSVTWPRVVDLNDRALRRVVVALGGRENGQPRETRFDIAVASEVMAVLALALDLKDLRDRLARITVAYTRDRKPVTAGELGVAGSMAVLLKDALRPNLLQTTEHTPMLVHTGPFGNIAHGNSSVLADLAGLKLADYVVTESGFGADMGYEKFMDIKCRASGVMPDAAVVVCTVRALKMHSGRFRIVAGRPLDPGLAKEDLETVALGVVNLQKHLENVRTLGVPAVVAINRFKTDTPASWSWCARSRSSRARMTRRSARSGNSAARAAHSWPRRWSRRPNLARAPTAPVRTPCTRWTCRSKRRSRPSRKRCTARMASSTCPKRIGRSGSTPRTVGTNCRSASPRRSTRCRTTRR